MVDAGSEAWWPGVRGSQAKGRVISERLLRVKPICKVLPLFRYICL